MENTSPVHFFRNNENFFLKDDELKKLIQKKAAFGKDRSVTYKNLYLKNPDYFEQLLQNQMKSIVRSDTSFDGLLLYANLERIRFLVNDMQISNDLKYKKPYQVYAPTSSDEIHEILNDYRLFDTETTGFGPLDQLTQFGIGIFKEKAMRQKAEFYVEKYKTHIPPDVIKLTGITNETIRDQGKPMHLVLDGITKLIDGQTIAGHNVSFDMDKITELFVDFKRTPPTPAKIIDTIEMFKVIIREKRLEKKIKNYKLDTLTTFFTGIDVKAVHDRHTALFDVQVTHKVLLKALEYSEEVPVESVPLPVIK